MKIPRWIEQPRLLALLTLAFALMPVAFAFVTFRAARERDAKLYESAAQVLGEQLKVTTFRHISFLNVMRNQWRSVVDPAHPPRTAQPPAGWMQRVPHLLAVGFASHDDEQHIMLRWQQGRAPVQKLGDNLAGHPGLAEQLRNARLNSAPIAHGVPLERNVMVVVQAVPDANDNTLVLGYLIGWLDLNSICKDSSRPLISSAALQARPWDAEAAAAAPADAQRIVISGEGETRWEVVISRGPGFSREYGTPTPWIGFAALGLSAFPLSLLVMLAARAGKLRSALEAEREIVRVKTHFLHSVSHEFRTPLSVIQSSADLLESYVDQLTPERRAQALNQIKASTTHMNDMVEQVLTLSRIESPQTPVDRKPVLVARLIDDIVLSVATATATGARCPVTVSCDSALEILSDATLLRSVISNLLSNAVKYSAPGSPVTIVAGMNEGAFALSVSDRGIGIPAEELERVREAFHRGSNARDVPGTGLGLAIATRCLALLGGTLHLQSTVGQGTLATVNLPLPLPPSPSA